MPSHVSAHASPEAAHRGLFIGLVNDAALFPPAARALPAALDEHRRHRASDHSDVVGPFLVGVPHVPALQAELRRRDTDLTVGLVARPGTVLAELAAAHAALTEDPRVTLASVDTAWTPTWRRIDLGDLPTNLEVGLGDEQLTAVEDVAAALADDDSPEQRVVAAKFRTGATDAWAWPDEETLATFICRCADHAVPFTLTGGLHHAIRGTHDVDVTPEEQHGLLNVVAAVHAAASGAGVTEVTGLLAERDPDVLVPLVAGLDAVGVALVRASFLAYGCCDVSDPVDELVSLNLLDDDA